MPVHVGCSAAIPRPSHKTQRCHRTMPPQDFCQTHSSVASDFDTGCTVLCVRSLIPKPERAQTELCNAASTMWTQSTCKSISNLPKSQLKMHRAPLLNSSQSYTSQNNNKVSSNREAEGLLLSWLSAGVWVLPRIGTDLDFYSQNEGTWF